MGASAVKPDRPIRPRTRVRVELVGLLLILVVTGLTQATALAAPNEEIRTETELVRASGRTSDESLDILVPDAVPEIYEQRRFSRLWSDRDRVATLIRAIRASTADGLVPRHYHLARIERLPSASPGGESAPSGRANAIDDILLTDSLARLVLDLRFGKVNRTARSDAAARMAAIERVLMAQDLSAALAALTPANSEYRSLRRALANYRRIAEAGGWPEIPAGPTIRPGDSDTRISLLVRRLAASGDLSGGHGGNDYDPTLQAAIRRFQSRHGLAVDAVIGPATLRALNVTVAARIDQVRVNLERLRWQRGSHPDPLVLVNIPAFEAQLIRDGAVEKTHKVIVGALKTPTPTFESELKYVVLNPTWTVPRSIASDELLPAIKADRGYLERFGYQVLDPSGSVVDPAGIDWTRLNRNNFAYSLVQQPGPANQLGRIKFMMPNEYAVFMHDTPGVNLFSRASRTFSHGCIRVENPVALATALMRNTDGDGGVLESRIASGSTQTVFLAEPVAIRIIYRTVTSNDGQDVRFFADVYGLDNGVLAALDKDR